MTLLRDLSQTIDGLFAAFLKLRASSSWEGQTSAIRRWIMQLPKAVGCGVIARPQDRSSPSAGPAPTPFGGLTFTPHPDNAHSTLNRRVHASIMPKRPSAAEERLTALSKLRGGPVTPEKLETLRAALGDKTTFIVAKAAKLAGELNATALTADLVATFDRLMANSGADKGCEAMTAIAEALKLFGASEAELFLRGIRHVQHEAGWGKPVDVAAGLRCECAFGLVRIGYRDVLWHLAALLADPEQSCRLAAARAIGASRGDAGLALLRYKVLSSGPEEADVVGECFSAMAEIDPAKAIPFLTGYLDSPDLALSESAALALGTTRRPDALATLKDHADRRLHPALRETLLLAIATLRIEPAITYLVSLVSQSDSHTAAQAIKALALYRRDESIRGQVAEAMAARKDPALQGAFEKEFH